MLADHEWPMWGLESTVLPDWVLPSHTTRHRIFLNYLNWRYLPLKSCRDITMSLGTTRKMMFLLPQRHCDETTTAQEIQLNQSIIFPFDALHLWQPQLGLSRCRQKLAPKIHQKKNNWNRPTPGPLPEHVSKKRIPATTAMMLQYTILNTKSGMTYGIFTGS